MNKIIPKTIHYCWFGREALPSLERKCIESWKRYCPNYEIVKWNEANFDINCCDYVREAYEAKKWAFVSDYARFKILYDYGGVYLDTDVELIQSIDDVVNNGNYMGCENYTPNDMRVNPGLGCASVEGESFYAEILKDYEKSHFKNSDGTLNLYTVVQRTTDLLKKYGLKDSMEIQKVTNITVYPADFFSPKDMRDGKLKITNNSLSIHHYTASWWNRKTVFYATFIRFIYRLLGQKGFAFLRKCFGKRNKETEINLLNK